MDTSKSVCCPLSSPFLKHLQSPENWQKGYRLCVHALVLSVVHQEGQRPRPNPGHLNTHQAVGQRGSPVPRPVNIPARHRNCCKSTYYRQLLPCNINVKGYKPKGFDYLRK